MKAPVAPVALVTFVFLVAFAPPMRAHGATCPSPIETKVREETSERVVTSWTFEDAPTLRATDLPPSAASRQFEAWVANRAPTDPFVLLEQSKSVYSRMGVSTAMWDLLLERRVGEIGPQSCLEEFLTNAHVARFPQTRKGSEFGAYVFRDAARGAVQVHALSNGTSSVPPNAIVDAAVEAERASGAVLEAHVHLHPFCFQEPDLAKLNGACGAVIPSDPDLGFFQRVKPERAVVTNGLSSLRLSPDDVEALVRTGR